MLFWTSSSPGTRTCKLVKITKRSLRRLASELGCICNGNYEHVEILYILHVSNWKTTFLCQISIFLNNSILTWSASSDPPFLDSFNPQARDERWPILFLLSGVFLFFLLSGVFLFLCHVGLFLVAAWDFLSWSPPPQTLVAKEVTSFGGS